MVGVNTTTGTTPVTTNQGRWFWTIVVVFIHVADPDGWIWHDDSQLPVWLCYLCWLKFSVLAIWFGPYLLSGSAEPDAAPSHRAKPAFSEREAGFGEPHHSSAPAKGKYYRGRTIIDFTNSPNVDLNED